MLACGPASSHFCFLVQFHVEHARVQRSELCCPVTLLIPHTLRCRHCWQRRMVQVNLCLCSITVSACESNGLLITCLWFPHKQGQRDGNQRVWESQRMSVDRRITEGRGQAEKDTVSVEEEKQRMGDSGWREGVMGWGSGGVGGVRDRRKRQY